MPKVKSKYQGKGGAFYMVNPAGAIHVVTRDHAYERMRTHVGFRLATDDEIEQYSESRKQVWDQPIAEAWNPEPEVLPDIPEEKDEGDQPPATVKAIELAQEYGIDLKKVAGSGASGRILVSDVEKAKK